MLLLNGGSVGCCVGACCLITEPTLMVAEVVWEDGGEGEGGLCMALGSV